MLYINIYFGGSLKQDIKNHSHIEHFALTEGKSLLKVYLGDKFTINSIHHQCIDKLGQNLSVIARSEDGIIEAIDNKDKKVFAVQWHPEKILEKNGLDIFDIFKSLL